MTDLAGRGALGQKPSKADKKPRKAVPRISKRRAAYNASQARVDGLVHMSRVAGLPCLICGAHAVEVHHCPDPRSDMRVLPLCPAHHRREYGPGAYHYSRRAFNEMHGSDDDLLARVAALLA